MKLIIVLEAILNLQLCVADIKDAFLSVRQRDLVEVVAPQWVQVLGEKNATNNPLLKAQKLLKANETAALRWSERLKELVLQRRASSLQTCEEFFGCMMIHVDDVLVTCNPDDWTWVSTTVRTHLTMNSVARHCTT